MTFEQLLVFHTIVRTGSFKSAALQLNKSQPAISFSIKKLEEEMGVDLFDRRSYRPALTAYGRSLLERSLKVVTGMHELEVLSQSFRHQEEPEISVAIDGISMEVKLLKLFKNFNDQYPHTKLNLALDVLSETERRIQERESLIGISHFIKDSSSLEIIPISTVQMVPVISLELFNEKKVHDQSKLYEVDQIVVADKNGPQGASFGLLEGAKKWRLEDPNFKRDIILAGLGWGHLPFHQVESEIRDKKLVVLNFKDIHPRELVINLIKLKKSSLGLVARALWEEIKSHHSISNQ